MVIEKVLCISDTHEPFAHPDSLDFILAIQKKYKIYPEKDKKSKVIHIGDEVTGNAISFHDKDPDALFTAGEELKAAIKEIALWHDYFPNVMLLDSNHGSLVYRKGKAAGLSRHVLKSYGDILEVGKGWTWHKNILLNCGRDHVFFHHGKSSAAQAKLSRSLGCSTVQGHYHTKFNIEYWRDGMGKNHFGMIIGCLIDNDAYDFDYNKTNLDDVMLGTGIIIEGVPKLIPMFLNSRGRWDGKIS